MKQSQQSFKSLRDLLVTTLQSSELTSHDIEVNGDEITFHLYDPDAPDLHSQDTIRIRMQLLPCLNQLKEENPEVYL